MFLCFCAVKSHLHRNPKNLHGNGRHLVDRVGRGVGALTTGVARGDFIEFKMAVGRMVFVGEITQKNKQKASLRTELNYWDLKYVLIEWNDALKINMKLWKPEILDVKQCSTDEAESLHSLATYQASAISYFKKLDSLPDDKFIVYMYINLFFIKQFCSWCFSSIINDCSV